ncbi:MAG TPA: MBL fold metallo-hydrolase [Methanocorpusculum sp.]|nr:MBL fold metallo-hydrolase [Methanocorpusculum sp.]
MITREDITPVLEKCRLSDASADELLEHANNPAIHADLDRLMLYAHFFSDWYGSAYHPRITSRKVRDCTVFCIEPECGSTTWVVESGRELLIIDTGFPVYQNELLNVLRELFPGFDARKKTLVLTHMDMDHAGLLSCFDAIYMSKTSLDDFRRRAQGKPNLRECVPSRASYYRITSIFSRDCVADTANMYAVSDISPVAGKDLSLLGHFQMAGLDFEVYETSGGHVEGAIILIEHSYGLVFCGDTYVNTDMRKEQTEFIKTSMSIMGSLNADSVKAKRERAAMFAMLEGGKWIVCGGHGGFDEYPKVSKEGCESE